MPIALDRDAAKSLLEQAIQLAHSTEGLPGEWYQATERIASHTSNATFVFALGTALLAKVVDEQVDPLALKAAGQRGYSARGLGHGVLRPVAFIEHGIHLGVTGREPLNNQPFFRYDRIDDMGRVRDEAARDDLIAVVRKIDLLSQREALRALAAFLRQRIDATDAMATFVIASGPNDLLTLAGAVKIFVHQYIEQGKIGQAFVAAGLDLVFEEVVTGRIHDPSVRRPGDVQALDGGRVVLAAEVRQKLSSPDDVRQYASDLRFRGAQRGLFAVFVDGQEPFPAGLRQSLWSEYGVFITTSTDPSDFLLDCAGWSGFEIGSIGARFATGFLERLGELEASEEAQAAWQSIVRDLSAG